MADANVVLRIGSALGPGGLASLQAGIQMTAQLGRAVLGVIKDVEQFGQVYRNLQIDISKADASTKGLIDTMALMQQANKFTAAGMELTAEEFDAVARLSADFAKKTGQDVTQAFNKLAESIQKGQSRALKQYGIELENSEDLLLAQSEALTKVQAQAEGVTVEIETLTETLFALGNNLGTTIGLIGNMKLGFDGLAGSGSSVNQMWAEFNSEISDVIQNGGTLGGVFDEIRISLAESIPFLDDYADRLNAMADAAVDTQREIASLQRQIQKERQKQFDEALRQLEAEGVELSREAVAEVAGIYGVGFNRGNYESSVGRKTSRRSKSGGAREQENVMEFSLSDVEEFERGQDDDLISSFGAADRAAADEEQAMAALGLGPDGQRGPTEEELERSRMYFDLLMEQGDWYMEQREESLTYADDWRNAWTESFNDVSMATFAANGAMQLYQSTVATGMKTLINGSKSGSEAFKAMVHDITEALAIEAAVKAAMEAAEAIASAASYDYGAAAQHTAAAALYGVVAAGLGVVAGLTKPSSVNTTGASNMGGGGGRTGYSSGGGGFYEPGVAHNGPGGGQSVHVSFSMAEDGWEAIVRKNEREINDGRRGFNEAA